MTDRGEHRSFYVSILDDPDFQSMDGQTFKLLFALKLMLGAAGIGVVRRLALAEVLGCSPEEIERSFGILEMPKPGEEFGWILRERNIVWLVNGLRHERGLSTKSPQHRSYVANQLKPLGTTRSIIARFRSYYPEWFGPTPDVEKREGQEGVERGYSGGQEGVRDHRERERKSDSTETLTSDSDRRFLEAFYADAIPKRRAEIATQLVAALSRPGARIRGNDYAQAKDRGHLDRCIAKTMAERIDKPNSAIVVLLKKLQDEEKDDRGRYPGEANVDREKAAIAKDDAYDRARRSAANDWAKEHGTEFEQLEQAAFLNCSIKGTAGDIVRNSWLLQEICKRISFPPFEEWLSTREVTAA